MRYQNRFANLRFALLVAVLGLSLFSALSVLGPAAAWAQDTEPAAGVKADAAAPADENVFVSPPADDAKPAAPTAPARKNVLTWFIESLGFFFSIVFLAISFILVSLLVMNIVAARREAMVPAALVADFESLLNEKNYQGAYDLAKNDDSLLGQVLSAGLAKLSRGYSHAIEGMQETGEEENMKLEHRLSYIALIGTVSPMIGLLGTVWGMIESFQVIATSPTVKTAELAEGISTALFTTLVGLAIAIPAIAAYNILRNRLARLVLEVGILSEDMMSRFSNTSVNKG